MDEVSLTCYLVTDAWILNARVHVQIRNYKYALWVAVLSTFSVVIADVSTPA
jgi:hypothetical protein